MRNAEGPERERACGILVCFALPEEARPFRKLAAGRDDVRVLVTGMGARNSERSFRMALDEIPHSAFGIPHFVLTCGFAGALNPALARGEVVFSAAEGGGGCQSVAGLKRALISAGAREVRFHCADKVTTTAAEKHALWQATRADAVEMESGHIRHLCRERGLPSATVRVISDSASEDLPLDFNLLMTGGQRLNYVKLAGALLKAPGKISALLRLQKQTRLAAEKLAAVLAEVLVPFEPGHRP